MTNDTASRSRFTDEVKELVAIGAAVAGNCEKCFEHHYQKAKSLGVSHEDMLKAATLGKAIKEMPAKAVSSLVRDRLVADAPMSTSDLPQDSVLINGIPGNREADETRDE
ncbi:carboxymuconolactone decarboxylase family protein [Methanofollis tationis]|uniref:Carboxymuconolactone decarboxylase family protein n=1 Tax=Methanofollis tationis TaxID=81417 RepID=A0A7K4HPP8_9EURY|nr:carboxymuconolactone decarboxylase family protein [Methanofollis tationis]NVO66880.1 carboxymuconolactone decarboxylase family protein [Methanofollis tationis]